MSIESEEVDREGCSGFSQGKGDTETFFLFTAVVSEVERGTQIPCPAMAEDGVLLNGHASIFNFIVPLCRKCIFFIQTHVGVQVHLSGIFLYRVVLNVMVGNRCLKPGAGDETS